jgi:hypothetical protein
VPIIKPAQIHKNKPLNRQNKYTVAGKSNVKVLGQNRYTLGSGNKSLIKTNLQLDVQLSLLMALAAEAHLAGELQQLKST